MSGDERAAAVEALEVATCAECGCHVSAHHVAGGCTTTFYGPPEEGFPSSSCTCDGTFAAVTAAALAAAAPADDAGDEPALLRGKTISLHECGKQVAAAYQSGLADGKQRAADDATVTVALAEELRLWRIGERSNNNFIVGRVDVGPEGQARLVREADTATIMALTAEVNVALAARSQPPATPTDRAREALAEVEERLREALNEAMIGLQSVIAEDRCEVLHAEEYARLGHECVECSEHAAGLLHDGWDERIVRAADLPAAEERDS